MTEKEINSCKKCIVCTGCGRGVGKQIGLQAVSTIDRASSGNTASADNLPGVDENALIIATDIGTTTIVMQLRRISDGEILDTFRAVNPQRKYGIDVLSRIRAAEGAAKKAEGVVPKAETEEVGADCIMDAAKDMQNVVHNVLKQGIERFGKKHIKDNIQGMVVAANATMVHLLMGYPVETLGKAPFTSEHLDEIETDIEGIKTIVMPGISAFVGADILAGMYACQTRQKASSQDETTETFLLLDLGTNGEMVLGNSQKLLATATAAGPAFEGRLDAGVWGADAIHFLAKLYEKGLVDETGLLVDAYFDEGVSIGSTVMTQEDIRSLQLAKAAVSAGITVLCQEFGEENCVESEENVLNCIDRVYLAGGFGYFLSPKDAVTIGLLPKELERKCIAVGNAALEGAFCYGRERLCKAVLKEPVETATAANFSGQALQKITDLKKKTQVYNLAQSHKFEQCYIEAINLP